MLNQVVLAYAALPGIGFELPHRVELVVAREDHGLFADLLSADPLFCGLEVDEVGQDVQDRVAAPDLLPEVGGLVAVGVVQVARPGRTGRG